MMRVTYIFTIIIVLATRAVAQSDNSAGAADNHLVLERMGIMYVGGKEAEMPSVGRRGGGKQTQIAGQAKVHYLIPPNDAREGKLPVVMVPGMGLTSYLYLSTPDGREGWAQVFAKAGHPVYVFDGPQSVMTGIEVGPFAKVQSGQVEPNALPRIMLWANEITWARWGIGTEPGKPLKDTRFPVEDIDQLYASMTAVISGDDAGGAGRQRRGGRPAATEEDGGLTRGPTGRSGPAFDKPSAETAALMELLDQIGPAIVVAHSAAGSSVFDLARRRSDLVKAIVAVEVVGSPTDPDDVKEHFADKRLIGVYGDNFEMRRMTSRYEATVEMAKQIRKAGGKAEVFRLPDMGIAGNSHLLMQDNNNHEIAEMILKRLNPSP